MNYAPDCADCPTPADCKAKNDCQVMRQTRHGSHQGSVRNATDREVYLCRASGEGSHNFRICSDEAGVFAFYEEMFGKHLDGTIDSEIENFRDPDNWSYEGTAYEVELYCAKWEVWKVDASELGIARTASSSGEEPA